MKIKDLFEVSDEDKNIEKTPAPKDNTLTTAQAAKKLNLTMARIRQLIGSGKLKAEKPTKGRRDHKIKLSDIQALKSKRDDKKK